MQRAARQRIRQQQDGDPSRQSARSGMGAAFGLGVDDEWYGYGPRPAHLPDMSGESDDAAEDDAAEAFPDDWEQSGQGEEAEDPGRRTGPALAKD